MSSWAAPRAAFAQQLMGFGLGQLAQIEENKENDKRFQMAQQAEKGRENARRQWEKQMLQYRQDLADKEVAQTFTDDEGRIIPVTQGEIRKGIARIPEAELRRRQAAQEQAAQDADLKRRKTESEIARNKASGRAQQTGQRTLSPRDLSSMRAEISSDLLVERAVNAAASRTDASGKPVSEGERRAAVDAIQYRAAVNRLGQELADKMYPGAAQQARKAKRLLNSFMGLARRATSSEPEAEEDFQEILRRNLNL